MSWLLACAVCSKSFRPSVRVARLRQGLKRLDSITASPSTEAMDQSWLPGPIGLSGDVGSERFWCANNATSLVVAVIVCLGIGPRGAFSLCSLLRPSSEHSARKLAKGYQVYPAERFGSQIMHSILLQSRSRAPPATVSLFRLGEDGVVVES